MIIRSYFFLFFLLSGCWWNKADLNMEMARSGHFELYTHPDAFKKEYLPPYIRRLTIVALNDFHGQLEPINYSVATKKKDHLRFQVGGAEYIASYINQFRNVFGPEMVLLDAGDFSQGTLLSDHTQGQVVVEFYNYLKVDAATLGNHEFDFGPKEKDIRVAGPKDNPIGAIEEMAKIAKFPLLTTNILEIQSGESLRRERLQPYTLKTFNGVKIGIIGGTTIHTPDRTIRENTRGLYFQDLADSTLRYAQILRNRGADLIILLAHAGTTCGDQFAKEQRIPKKKSNFEPETEGFCDKEGEIAQVLTNLPPHTVDLVVAGNTHDKIANFIHQTPVIQSYSKGEYISWAQLYFDERNSRPLRKKTKIFQPIQTCHQFFKVTNDCFHLDPSVTYDSLTDAKIFGNIIKPDSEVSKTLSPFLKSLEKENQQLLRTMEEEISHDKFNNSQLAHLFAKSFAQITETNISFVNVGSIRAGLKPGPLRYGELYEIAPFNNYLVKVKLTGLQLKQLVAIASSGHQAGQGIFHGLKIQLNSDQGPVLRQDLNKNGVIDDWEINRVFSIKLSNGEPIKDNQNYDLVTTDFIAIYGGDHYQYIFDQIPNQSYQEFRHLNYRDVFKDYLLATPSLGPLSSSELSYEFRSP